MSASKLVLATIGLLLMGVSSQAHAGLYTRYAEDIVDHIQVGDKEGCKQTLASLDLKNATIAEKVVLASEIAQVIKNRKGLHVSANQIMQNFEEILETSDWATDIPPAQKRELLDTLRVMLTQEHTSLKTALKNDDVKKALKKAAKKI